MLNVILLNVVMLSVVMLNVMAPFVRIIIDEEKRFIFVTCFRVLIGDPT